MSDAETQTPGTVEPAPAEHHGWSGWWRSSHPTFAGVMGFFSGMAFTVVVPGLYAAVLGLMFSPSRAEALFPFVLIALAVPIGLLVPRKTRRFAQFMLFGIAATLVVVAVTTFVVLWVLLNGGK